MKNDIQASKEEITYLLSPIAIRERATKIFDLTKEGKTSFLYHPEKLDETVEIVEKVTKENYPDLNIPFHSRWGHFNAGGIDRNKKLDELLSHLDIKDRCRAKLDLVIISVLLDAGAGDNWKYEEKSSGKTFNRSEGLAIASFHMFIEGVFSNDENDPYRCDNSKLAEFTVEDLRNGFQVSENNPLEGIKGRVSLIKEIANSVAGRPGNIIDLINGDLKANQLLYLVLTNFGNIWPGRISVGETNLGDVWSYSKLGNNDKNSLVPFHKLSQWLTYSMIEPIVDAGINITDLNSMTGLPEYRNGGLILDSGLITLKDETNFGKEHLPSSDLIIEWRALTICLLDTISDELRKRLGKTEEEFPLVKALEGGTWWAGRRLAAKREGGGPPLKLKSDGTVF